MTRWLPLLCVWLHVAGAWAAVTEIPVPPLAARVTDLTQSLNSVQAAQLENKLAEFERRSGGQVVVLILPTTQPETIEQFGIRVLEAWKIGRKGVDDGAILLVAKDDRRVRIEVAYGFEGRLTDAAANRIISNDIAPRFKAGDFAGGIDAGVDGILQVVGTGTAAEGETPRTHGTTAHGGLNFAALGEQALVLGVGALAVGGAVLRFFLGNLLGSGVLGALVGGVTWWLLGSVGAALIGAVAGFFIALFGMDLILSGILSRGGRSGGGGGGFRGGGGLGGGGGASGSW